MEPANVGKALQRVVSAFERRPGIAMHADSPANARWVGGLKTNISHPSGNTFLADMPAEFGGGGAHVTPGWFMRAGAASCTATCIAMAAARRGVKLTHLEVIVTSRSDARGNLGMFDEQGERVDAAPTDLEMLIRIAARDETPAALETLAADGMRSSSVARALEECLPIALRVEHC